MLTYLYAFILGYITAKVFSGSHEHISGPLGSIIIHLNKLKIHLHHWLIGFLAVCVILLVKVFMGTVITLIEMHTIIFFIGIIFQGIIEFKDWKEVIIK